MSIKETKQTSKKMAKNIEELLNAVALSTTTVFAGYAAFTHRGQGILWILLGAAAAWSVIQAFVAWVKVLNK